MCGYAMPDCIWLYNPALRRQIFSHLSHVRSSRPLMFVGRPFLSLLSYFWLFTFSCLILFLSNTVFAFINNVYPFFLGNALNHLNCQLEHMCYLILTLDNLCTSSVFGGMESYQSPILCKMFM